MNLTSPQADSPKRFTVDEANRMLPLVRAIAGDIQSQQDVVDTLSQRLKRLTGEKKPAKSTDAEYSDVIKEFRRELDLVRTKLLSFRHEASRLGLISREPAGHCDFPTIIDGHNAELCWMYGEPEVLYWHHVDEPFSARKPLVAEAGTIVNQDSQEHDWTSGNE